MIVLMMFFQVLFFACTCVSIRICVLGYLCISFFLLVFVSKCFSLNDYLCKCYF